MILPNCPSAPTICGVPAPYILNNTRNYQPFYLANPLGKIVHLIMFLYTFLHLFMRLSIFLLAIFIFLTVNYPFFYCTIFLFLIYINSLSISPLIHVLQFPLFLQSSFLYLCDISSFPIMVSSSVSMFVPT